MVCEWGMSEKMGMVEYGEHEDYVFLGRDIAQEPRTTAKPPRRRSIAEVRKLCDDAYDRAKELIGAHRDKLEIIAKALLEFETLDGDQVRDIIEHGRMQNPPARPTPPGTPPPLKTRPENETTIAPEITPGLTEAPA